MKDSSRKEYRRIATEEAFATRDQIAQFRKLLASGYDDPGFLSLWGFYLNSPSDRARFIVDRLQDLGPNRIADMDASGIDMQVLSLTSPGVQVFDAATANALATSANDELAEAIRKYPTRYVGLAAAAPQDPKAAAKEIERGVNKLGLKGVIMNSHTMGERLDDPRFWDIFAAAESLDVPIYLHPNSPPRDMIRPYLEILKVRMEERLVTRIEVPDGLLSAEFPPMMIQSLVENAIKHGLEPKAEGGSLTLKAEIVHGKLQVTVADTGLGFGRAATSGTGVGLANIRERLSLLYGKAASLTVAENQPSGTVVTITVPYRTSAHHAQEQGAHA